MKNKERIERICDDLKELWLQESELRFGQLIYTLLNKLKKEDIFNIPDEEWRSVIRNQLNEHDEDYHRMIKHIVGYDLILPYEDTGISYEILKNALSSGYSLDEIKGVYETYDSSDGIQNMVTFEEFITIAIAMKNSTLK
jgi:hypothetical protein